jgi:putative OPT family oligopeptide transporter
MAFGILARLGVARQISLLENNAVQSTATAAGYMTGLVTASLPAYMMVTGKIFPMWQAIVWAASLAVLGVLFAFPWKRRFINSGEYPFPEGKAAAIVMDGLHSDNPDDRIKTTILARGGIFAAAWAFVTGSKWAFLPDMMFNWFPKVSGVAVQTWSINVSTDAAMIGVGGIIGIRTGLSWLLGGILNFMVLVPLLVHFGVLAGDGLNYRAIVSWTMWPGVAMITTASLYPFVTKLDIIKSSFSGLGRSTSQEEDVLKEIELPMGLFYVGIPVVSLAVVLMGNAFFGINIFMGLGSIVLISVFTLIAVNSTALTSFTPSSALAKLSQVYAAVLTPGNAGVNLATGSIAAEVTGNAANLLMDIKAGWFLGAKPRQQAIAHVIGASAGSCACTPVFYYLFAGDISKFGSDDMPLPGAKIWQGLAMVLNEGLSAIPLSARWGMLAGVLVGVLLEWVNTRYVAKYNKPFPISAIGLSLGFVVQFFFSATIAFGALVFWMGSQAGAKKEGGLLYKVFTADDGGVTLASSLIAGAGLAGILILLFAS